MTKENDMKWISIENRLPQRRRPVLILCSYGKMATAILSDDSKPSYGWIDWMRAGHSYGSVTHWMPLPKPPNEIDEKKKKPWIDTEWIDNECNYSHEWQQYQAEYDKYEYDIKLLDGTIVENCYPNGGIFHSISDKHNKQGFDENDIDQIRFSKNPKYGINPDDTDGRE